MFDIGGWEFLVIAILAIIVIGPKDLPATVRIVSQWARKARGLAREFQSGLDEMAREADALPEVILLAGQASRPPFIEKAIVEHRRRQNVRDPAVRRPVSKGRNKSF